MNKYESVIIVNPNLDEAGVKALEDKFTGLINENGKVEEVVKKLGLAQISDTSVLEEMIIKIVNNHPDSVKDYKEGKDRAIKFLMGQVMKETKGQANPSLAMEILKAELSK